MNNSKYFVGAKFNSKSGGGFEIIEIIDSNNVKIKFLDEFQFEKIVNKDSIFKGIDVGRLHVDKDILSGGTSIIYSPETCCIIQQEINAFFIGQNRAKVTGLPASIIKSTNGYRISQLHGHILNKEFSSLEDAVSFRDKLKQQILNELVMKYFDVLEDRVIFALIEYYK